MSVPNCAHIHKAHKDMQAEKHKGKATKSVHN